MRIPLRRKVALLLVSSGLVALSASWVGTARAQAPSGRVWAWGHNYSGQLGVGTLGYSLTPVLVSSLTDVTAVAAGWAHSLALRADGTVWAWGNNQYGQLGVGSTVDSRVPVRVALPDGIVAVAAGVSHSLALRSDGTVWAWGANFSGQLGIGTTTDSHVPVQVSALASIVSIAAGTGNHSFAATALGTLWAWGDNTFGQLGNGTLVSSSSPVAARVPPRPVAVAAGGRHSLAVTGNGLVQTWAWGENAAGQLGRQTSWTPWPWPWEVIALTEVSDVAAGGAHSLAVRNDGSLWAWGDNAYGQLGTGLPDGSPTPVAVGSLTDVVAVSASQRHSLALRADGTLWAWGDNEHGKLGNGTTASSRVPVRVGDLTGVVAAAAGGTHGLAIGAGGTIWSWGDNLYGQLGTGTPVSSLVPASIGTLDGVVAIAAGALHSLAVDGAGALWSWGDNRLGQLGVGTTGDAPSPARVPLPLGSVTVAAGVFHSLALSVDGTIWSWGDNRDGQLGSGTTTNSAVPVRVETLRGVVGLDAGSLHSIARRADGTVWAWGNNSSGQLGTGSGANNLVPDQVSTLRDVTAVAAGSDHSLALDVHGAVWAWGSNYYGQLGTGSTGDSAVPVRVSGLPAIVAIAAGDNHSLALESDGTLWAWGANGDGQLGDGTTNRSTLPIEVVGLPAAVAIAAGSRHSLAIGADGRAWAWGDNMAGQLGIGTTVDSVVPVAVGNLAGVAAMAGGALHSLALVGTPYSPDGDRDGLLDAWEVQLGLNPLSNAGNDGASGDPDGDGATNAQEFISGTHPRGFHTRYFAEGATGPLFDYQIALLNTGASRATVLLRFLKLEGSPVSHVLSVPARSRRTVVASRVPGVESVSAVSTVVESDVPVVADRTMSWDGTAYGGHAETGIASPALTWFLAEGATHSGFDLFYLIQNPNAAAVDVEVTYLRPTPQSPIVRTYRVAASSRFNIWVDLEEFPPGSGNRLLASTDLSAIIRSLDASRPIIVERAMYLPVGQEGQPGYQFFGAGHASAGVTAPATSWYIAEGATLGGFFDLYLLIANPNPTGAEVDVRYLLPGGATLTRAYEVAGNSRRTIFVNAEHPWLADTSLSAAVTSNVPIVVERAMWWPGPTWATWFEAHGSPGATATGTLWASADGEQGGPRRHETYLLIANTSAFAGRARVTLIFEDGSPSAETEVDLPASSRVTFYPPWEFPAEFAGDAHRAFGAIVESLGPTPAQIVVERAMYWDAGGVRWAAGTAALAALVR